MAAVASIGMHAPHIVRQLAAEGRQVVQVVHAAKAAMVEETMVRSSIADSHPQRELLCSAHTIVAQQHRTADHRASSVASSKRAELRAPCLPVAASAPLHAMVEHDLCECVSQWRQAPLP